MSVYDEMQISYRFSMSAFHFSSVSGQLQKDGLKNKINRCINSPTQINIGNEWLYCEVMIFP